MLLQSWLSDLRKRITRTSGRPSRLRNTQTASQGALHRLWHAEVLEARTLLSSSVATVQGAPPNLQTSIDLPPILGYHHAAALQVHYTNSGTVAIPAPILVVSAVQNGIQGAFLTLDPTLAGLSFASSTIPSGFSSSVEILANGSTPGVLKPGESETVPLYYGGWLKPWNQQFPKITFNIGVVTSTNTGAINWTSLTAGLKPATVPTAAWNVISTSLQSNIGNKWGGFVSAIDNDAAYLGQFGENVLDVNSLWGFEIQKEIGFNPVSTLAATTDIAVPVPGLPLALGRSFSPSIVGRNETGQFGTGWALTGGWDRQLATLPDGTVTISGPNGAERLFALSLSHVYTPELPGDHGTLTKNSDGTFLLTEADGTATLFNTAGGVAYSQDTNGNRITAGYTGMRLTSLTDSSGASLSIAYNAGGLIQSITSSDGRQVLYAYDASQHLIAVTSVDGRTTRYAYSSGSGAATSNALLSITSPAGTHEFFTYDSIGRLASLSRDSGLEMTTFAYGNQGTVTATDSTGHGTTYFYDDRALLVGVKDALGDSTFYSYDSGLNPVRVTNAAGLSQNFTYDASGNVASVTDPLGQTTRLTYGAFGRPTSVTDPRSNTTQYAYSAQGDLTSTISPDGSSEVATYNAVGDPLTITNARRQVTNRAYNAAGQVVGETFDDGTTAAFVYDAHGNIVSATNSQGTTKFAYSLAGDLVSVVYPDGSFLAYSYDSGGRRVQMVDQTGFTVNYVYDVAGRLAALTDAGGAAIVTYTYDAAGRISQKNNGNGSFTTYAYDADGNVLHLVNYAPGRAVVNSRFDYSYDVLGRRTSMGTLDGTWTYTYDADGQLLHAVFASTNPAIANQDLTYVYDPAGNRVQTIENGVTTQYTTNKLNQYTQVGPASFTYDADGNLISKTDGSETATYTYDSQNRLVGVVSPAGTWSYQYDALGNRIATIQGDQQTHFLIDPVALGNVTGVFNAGGSVTAHYTYALGLVSQIGATGGADYYDFDVLGSTADLTDPSGAIANSYAYAPFGASLLSTGTPDNPFQFIGQFGVMTESNELDFMRERFYSAGLGGFLSTDPLGVDQRIYVTNSPVNFLDPAGLFEVRPGQLINGLAQTIGGGISVAGGFIAAGGTGGALAIPAGVAVFTGSYQATSGIQNIIHSFGPDSGIQNTGGIFGDTATAFTNNPWILGTASAADAATGWFGTGRIFTNLGNIVTSGVPFLTGFLPSWTLKTPPPNPPQKVVLHGSVSASGSADPNDIVGPVGYGAANFVAPNSVLPYQIDFENAPTATAPAQEVDVVDPLDPHLDWSTFQLTEITFGHYVISVPPGQQSFEAVLPVTFSGRTFNLKIQAGIDLQTGVFTVTFLSVDPTTSLPPDLLTGFLPPEDGSGRGKGTVGFTVQPRAGLPVGTQIRNVAEITFDGGDAVATDQIDPFDPSKGIDPGKEALVTIGPLNVSATPVVVSPPTAVDTALSAAALYDSGSDIGGSDDSLNAGGPSPSPFAHGRRTRMPQ